jgi:dTDP-4-amino-4,6-dideoxygalactose transaminase
MSHLAINGGPQAAGALHVPKLPLCSAEDKQAVLDVLDGKPWCCLYKGSQAEQFAQAYAEFHDARYGVAVTNGTVAIELALQACGVKPGDEVLVPALTFIASASAIVTGVGAIPVFVDSDPETLSMSADAAETAITSRTRAILVVHYGGYPVDLDRFVGLAQKYKLALIEDCAHAQGTEWRGRKVGAFGSAGTFSFQESKAFTAGEGGVVLTNDAAIYERLRLLHNIGRAVGRPGYEHVVLASNHRMLEIQAALLLSQLRRFQNEDWRAKSDTGEFLAQGLAQIGGVQPLKRDPRITRRGYYFYIFRYDRSQFGGLARDRFLDALRAEGVPCYAGYAMPLYKQPAFRRENVAAWLAECTKPWPDYDHMHLPVAEHFCAEEQVTIPHPVLLTGNAGAQMILDAVTKIKANIAELL